MDVFAITETYQATSSTGGTFWVVVTTSQAGERHQHAFPTDTLLWRAAEYGIDPDDTETLLDIILHEPHITPAEALAEPVTLAAARTTGEAKTAHLARIAAVKARRRITGIKAPAGKSTPDPLAPIRSHQHAPGRLAEIQAMLAGTVPAHGHMPPAAPRRV
ncbi:hypothetical protein ACGFZP_13300 [Kitasatospora sp. NPDC048239]|uniref:hypothetical protein n=1 Tax=Kitasatospora sp. NPDC048239 TaxID=3364046 RepID=UPI00371C0A54